METLVGRRTILLSGVVAGSMLAVGGTIQWVSRAAAGASVLSQAEIDIVEAIGRALFPAGFFPVSGGDEETSREVDRILAHVIEPNAVTPFRTMLGALEWGTLVSRGTRFSKLDPKAQYVLSLGFDPFPRRLRSTHFRQSSAWHSCAEKMFWARSIGGGVLNETLIL